MKKNVLKWFIPLFALSLSMKVMAVEVVITDHVQGNLSAEIAAELGDDPDFTTVTTLTISGGNLVNSTDGVAIRSCTNLTKVDVSGVNFTNGNMDGADGNGLFGTLKFLETAILPVSVKEIGRGAFLSCERLEEVLVRNADGNTSNLFRKDNTEIAIRTFHSHSFRNCYLLEIKELPVSITNMGERVFENCRKLNITEIPGFTNNRFQENLFRETAITEFTFPASINTLLKTVFYTTNANLIRTFIIRNEVIALPSGNDNMRNVFGSATTIANTTVKILKKHADNYSAWTVAGIVLDTLSQDISVQIAGNGTVSVAGAGLAGDEGAVSDGEVIKAYEAEDIAFTCTPDEGYALETVLLDGEEITSGQALTIDEKAQKTLTVTFVEDTNTGICPVDNDGIQIRYNQQTNVAELSGGLNAPVRLYNGIGRYLLETTENRIDLTTYKPGLYILKAGSQTIKLLKK